MTKDEAVKLPKEINNYITGEGITCSSGYFAVCRETIDETDYLGHVDVSVQRNESLAETEYAVYSVACEDGGEDISNPEWETVHASIPDLAQYLLKLANVTFQRSEIERLASA